MFSMFRHCCKFWYSSDHYTVYGVRQNVLSLHEEPIYYHGHPESRVIATIQDNGAAISVTTVSQIIVYLFYIAV